MLDRRDFNPTDPDRQPSIPIWPDSFADEVVRQIQKAEKGLQEDEELSVVYSCGNGNRISIERIGLGSGMLVLLEGRDQDSKPVKILATTHTFRLELRVQKTQRSGTPTRIDFFRLHKNDKGGNAIGFRVSEEGKD